MNLQKGIALIILVVVLVLIIAGYVFVSKIIPSPVEPPNTVITFSKTVNFIADQFTEKDILKAKELGANIITIWPTHFIRDDEFIFFPERTARFIVFAHQNGLQVELRDSFGSETIKDYQRFKANAVKYVARFAKFAERYKVYRIVPFGEIDNTLFNNQDKVTEFAKETLQEMRKHYSGKIGVGIAAPWRDSGYNFEGYDYLTISAYPQASTGMDVWLTKSPEINVYNVIAGARKVADRSSISVLHIGEVGVVNPDDQKRPDFKSFAMVSKEKEAEFFRKFFEQVSGKVEGVSVFYNSKFDYLSVNNDPAENVVKEWFGKPLDKTVPG